MGGEGEDTQAVARSASRRPHKEAGDLGLFERGSERRRLGKEDDTPGHAPTFIS